MDKDPVVERVLRFMFCELGQSKDRNIIHFPKKVWELQDIDDGMMIAGRTEAGLIRVMHDIMVIHDPGVTWVTGDNAYYVASVDISTPRYHRSDLPETGFPIREKDLKRGIYRMASDR